jgi:hypothetical protein
MNNKIINNKKIIIMNWLVRNSINDLFGVQNENSEMIDSDYQEKSKSKTS